MANRTTDEVRRELATERVGLEHAATTLRTQSGTVAKRIAIATATVAVVVIAVRVITSRVFADDEPGKRERGRFSFLGND
jgi:hypothetical protein